MEFQAYQNEVVRRVNAARDEQGQTRKCSLVTISESFESNDPIEEAVRIAAIDTWLTYGE